MTDDRRLRSDQSVRAAQHVRSRAFDDELVLLDLGGGEYFSLNAVGTKIWQEAVTGRTPDQIATALVVEYDVTREEALVDCLELLHLLLARGLVTLATA